MPRPPRAQFEAERAEIRKATEALLPENALEVFSRAKAKDPDLNWQSWLTIWRLEQEEKLRAKRHAAVRAKNKPKAPLSARPPSERWNWRAMSPAQKRVALIIRQRNVQRATAKALRYSDADAVESAARQKRIAEFDAELDAKIAKRIANKGKPNKVTEKFRAAWKKKQMALDEGVEE